MPSFSRSEEVLESEAAECYNRMGSLELDRASVPGLQEVFVSCLATNSSFGTWKWSHDK